jgi:hypothetical protein
MLGTRAAWRCTGHCHDRSWLHRASRRVRSRLARGVLSPHRSGRAHCYLGGACSPESEVQRRVTVFSIGYEAPASSEEIFSYDTNNHDAVEDRQEATGRNGAESENGNTQGIWFPRPDDPSPTETSRTHNDEEESDSMSPLQPQPEPESDTFDHIRKLDELRNEGLIVPKEFEARRRKLLDRI